MESKQIAEMFDSGGWIKYHKTIGRELGIEAAISLGNLIEKHIYWTNRGIQDWFHLREDIQYETCLTPHQQRKGEKKLEHCGLISTIAKAPKGQCKRINFYTVHFDAIKQYLIENHKSLKSLTTMDSNPQPLKVKNVDGNKNKDNKNKLNKKNNIRQFDVGDEPQIDSPAFSLKSLKSKGEELNIHTKALDESKSNKQALDSIYSVEELEFEPEEVNDDLEFQPALKTSVDKFIILHKKAKRDHNLAPVNNYSTHIDNLLDAPEYMLETYLKEDYVISLFFEYCDDKSYEWNVRYYECTSDRSPSVMVNESVYYRFLDWLEKNKDELTERFYFSV